MYQYTNNDKVFLQTRVAEFENQVQRRLRGELSEDEFRPLRLMNGLYLQLHAYMLRIAIPYGVLSSVQLRALAHIGRKYDKNFGHFTTRQNIQFNWIKLVDTPNILRVLQSVDMHAIQTSGNCIRNVTTDPFAGVAADEVEDPRAWAEILRQWSSLHPEFSFLPRKFKIAITGAKNDRAAIYFHDIGLQLVKNKMGEVGFKVLVGGGQGRTPFVAKVMQEFLPKNHLLSYLEAMLRVYNLYGRRDNIYKARIKILVHEIGIDQYRNEVDTEWNSFKDNAFDLSEAEKQRIIADFAIKPIAPKPIDTQKHRQFYEENGEYARWFRANIDPCKDDNFANVTIVLKNKDRMPGDATSDEMDKIADISDIYSHGEIRVSYIQNLVLPRVHRADLINLFNDLKKLKLVDGLKDSTTDIICCPGLDYCNLANARSLPMAAAITERFHNPEDLGNIGKVRINMSGCINACGHHHAGHIGVLGVDKKGEEAYQILLGGNPDDGENAPAIGQVIGRAIAPAQVPEVISRFLQFYTEHRLAGETFLTTYQRMGHNAFKGALDGLDTIE